MNRPFDAKRYRRLLEGLEVTVLKLSEVEAHNPPRRLDAEYFDKGNLRGMNLLRAKPFKLLGESAFVTDGIHASIHFQEGSGIRVLSAMHPKSNFFDLSQCEEISFSQHAENPRTALRVGDVLVSTVGTIGNAATVTDDVLPANSDRHVGIVRCKPELPPEFLSTFLVCRYGRLQSIREATGNVQLNLFLSKLRDIVVPSVSDGFAARIASVVRLAHLQRQQSQCHLTQAETTLAAALGLENWHPPQPLSYTRRASQAFTAGRLDAEYFREAYVAARKALEQAGAVRFVPLEQLLSSLTNGHTPLRHDLTVGEVPFLCAEHVADFELSYDSDKRILRRHHQTELARTRVKDGDVLLSIKGRVGNFALAEAVPGTVNINQDVALLRFKDTLPIWWVLAFLNSPFGKLQVQQHCTGGINPFLGLGNVRKLLVAEFEDGLMDKVGEQTREKVHAARAARRRAHDLLAAAQRAVEIAIEQDEAAALAHLAGFGIAP